MDNTCKHPYAATPVASAHCSHSDAATYGLLRLYTEAQSPTLYILPPPILKTTSTGFRKSWTRITGTTSLLPNSRISNYPSRSVCTYASLAQRPRSKCPHMSLCRSQLEGTRQPRPFSELLEKPELRFHGVQQPYVIPVLSSLHTDTGCARGFSDIYVTCQLVADNKPLTIPFRTSFKSFKKEYVYVTSYTHQFLSKLK